VLANRGIKPDDVDHYLHTTDKDIPSFRLLSQIDEGLKMLVKHISQNDKVLI
jgi:hypothetical protein